MEGGKISSIESILVKVFGDTAKINKSDDVSKRSSAWSLDDKKILAHKAIVDKKIDLSRLLEKNDIERLEHLAGINVVTE